MNLIKIIVKETGSDEQTIVEGAVVAFNDEIFKLIGVNNETHHVPRHIIEDISVIRTLRKQEVGHIKNILEYEQSIKKAEEAIILMKQDLLKSKKAMTKSMNISLV